MLLSDGMADINITIIQGTDREGRKSLFVSKLIQDVGAHLEDVSLTLVDPKNFDFSYSHKDKKFTEIVQRSDAFIIVAPEYNHSIPGTLKTLLDTELKLYIHKPVALVGVSSGPWGGVRAVESLVPVVRELGLAVTFTDVYFPFVQKLFNNDGSVNDEKYIDLVNAMYEELLWMTKVMKWGRENLPSKHH